MIDHVSGTAYLDADVAYLCGLVTARGTFHTEGDVHRLIIDFPHKLLRANPPPDSGLVFDIQDKTRLALDDARRRINELLEVNVEIDHTANNVQLNAVFTKNTMAWRNLRLLFADAASYQSFAVPAQIFEAPLDLQKEFVRGYADAAATHLSRTGTGPACNGLCCKCSTKTGICRFNCAGCCNSIWAWGSRTFYMGARTCEARKTGRKSIA